MNRLVFLFLLGLFSTNAYGQEKGVSNDSTKKTKGQLIPLPAIYFTPETRLAVGCIGVYLFKTDGNARTSNIDFAAVFTQNKQIIIEPIYNIFTNGEKYFIKGSIIFTKFPEFFYGIGNETAQDTKENLSYKTFRVNNRVLRQMYPHLFMGFQHYYFKTYNVKFPQNSSYPPGSIPGDKGSITSGIGPAVVYDTRDNILNATKGVYAEFSSTLYRKAFGSEFEFTNFTVDLRAFNRITSKAVLAIQGLVNFNVGHVPFKQQATIGGYTTMRGYYNGRYRDKNLVVLQAEWRQHLYKRLGCTVFANVGDVASKINGFNVDDMKATVGGGLRYQLSQKGKINIRFDAGFGRNTHGFYINISEAF